MSIQQIFLGAGGGGSIVDDYFSKKIYTGTSSAQSVTTDLDLTCGGLTWIKVNNTNNWNHTWAYDENVVLFANKEDSEFGRRARPRAGAGPPSRRRRLAAQRHGSPCRVAVFISVNPSSLR